MYSFITETKISFVDSKQLNKNGKPKKFRVTHTSMILEKINPNSFGHLKYKITKTIRNNITKFSIKYLPNINTELWQINFIKKQNITKWKLEETIDNNNTLLKWLSFKVTNPNHALQQLLK